MIRNSFFVSLVLFALCLLVPYVSEAEYIIDGGPTDAGEWDYTASDGGNDVVPVQVDAIDIRWFGDAKGHFRTSEQMENELGFILLLNFGLAAPTPFAGPEERSLEIFFDTVAKAGDLTTVWKDTSYDMGRPLPFAPDQRARLTWKEERIVEFAFAVWDGSAWKTQHLGPSIPEMEAGLDRWWMEVAVRWSYITPQRYTEGEEDYTPFAFALQTTQGEAHDYWPNPGYEYWSCGYAEDHTNAVRAVTWGWLKAQMK